MLQDDYNIINKSTATDAIHSSFSNARRICKSCRRRVGLCFLCHEPVKGVYVWCPGCGTCLLVGFYFDTFIIFYTILRSHG